jgi:hypothetical protein
MSRRALLVALLLLTGCAAPFAAETASAAIAEAPLRPVGHEGEAIAVGLLLLALTGVLLVCALVDVLLLPVYFARGRDDDFLFPCCQGLFSLF